MFFLELKGQKLYNVIHWGKEILLSSNLSESEAENLIAKIIKEKLLEYFKESKK